MNDSALMIVDMQRYYLESDSAYSRYFDYLYPGSLRYIKQRADEIVIPNIIEIAKLFRRQGLQVIYLRLCGEKSDRSDLHRFFMNSYIEGKERGFEGVYPLFSEPEADVVEQLRPEPSDIIINKTTFSPFASTGIDEMLKKMGINSLVFTGLATSQCVETTARDASDRGYEVIHIEDAQADYDEMTHNASLFSSRGVCGGVLFDTEEYLSYLEDFI
ncbi:MAG TPA: isochorismatase family cysteine hydrolase [Spirochaetota bacterium]|nr:isochorismatase family cysteine hydrolase [Spirochaetota bacterium]HPJ35135.1 isochorismatase family cysteine hydrolase [Spirochaetota bacterium]